MPGTKLSGSGARLTPRHAWTTEQKRCLLLLLPDPENPLYVQATAQFNQIFKDEINRADFPNGLPISSIRSQYREHKQGDNASWAQITNPRSWELEHRLRDELTARVEQSIGAEGERLQTASVETVINTPARKRKRSTRDFDADAAALLDSEDETVCPALNETRSSGRALAVLIPTSEARNRAAYRIVDEEEEADVHPVPRTPTKRTKVGFPSPRNTIQSVASRYGGDDLVADAERMTLNQPATPASRKTILKLPMGYTRTGDQQPPGFVLFQRANGPPVWLTPAELARAHQGWLPPSSQEAHPQLAGMFFRFHDDAHSRAKLSDDGIVAEKHLSANCAPVRPPPVEFLDPTDVLNHLDQQKKETPFVSVSDSLVWCLSKVLKKAADGRWANAKVSSIDARKLSANAVFHALPFYRQLQSMWALNNKTCWGVSAHEFLIWHKVPTDAIIKTFEVRDIMQAAASSSPLGRVLQLHMLSKAGDYQQALRPRLQQSQIKLSAAVAAGMAEIAMFVGIKVTSSYESHRYIITELISSYGLVVEHLSEDEWRNRAAMYTHAFCRRSEDPVSITDQQKLKSAFLEGTCLGATKDFRWPKLAPASPEKVRRTAQRLGLAGRDGFAAQECDAAKLYLMTEQGRQRRMLEDKPSHRLLADENGNDDRDNHVFEMNDDGIVVQSVCAL